MKFSFTIQQLLLRLPTESNFKTETKTKKDNEIIHVCPVEGQKMKLLTDHQHILKIIPSVPGKRFNRNWNSKKIRISGTIQETRLSASYINSIERTGTLLAPSAIALASTTIVWQQCINKEEPNKPANHSCTGCPLGSFCKK